MTKMFLEFKQVLFSDFEWQIFKNGQSGILADTIANSLDRGLYMYWEL